MPLNLKRPSLFAEPPDEVKALLRRSASNDLPVAMAAQRELAVALELPLRKGNLVGDITGDIFERINLEPDAAPEFPLDLLAPGVENEHRAYAIPGHGRIPERTFEADYIMIPTFEIGSSIDWPLKLARNARWDIVGRALEVFEAGFVKKSNDDAFHTVITAAARRNVFIYDPNAGAGRLSLRLITLMQQAMRRNAGGNTASLMRGFLTDVYMSIEMLEDMRNWTIADVPEGVRNQVFSSAEGYVGQLFNTRLHDLIELGSGQEYQNFYTDADGLNGALAPGDVELLIGLDLQRNDSFVNPIRQPLQVFEDGQLHRQRRAGVYGWLEHGFGILDNRRLLLASA